MKPEPAKPTMSVASAFHRTAISLRFSEIDLLREVTPKIKQSTKYAQIAASISEVGLIEPPVVAHHPAMPGRYLLLDGHLRTDILRSQGRDGISCLLATDDEAFTYNKRISRLAAIQEHRMILKLVEKKAAEMEAAKKAAAEAAAKVPVVDGGTKPPEATPGGSNLS